MDIFEVLKLEHTQIRSQLDGLIEATSSTARANFREELADRSWKMRLENLVRDVRSYHEVGDDVVLSALREMPRYKELADSEQESDRYVDELLNALARMTPADRDWSQQISMVKTQIEARIAEVESEVFDVLRTADTVYANTEDLEYDAIETPQEDIVDRRAVELGRAFLDARKTRIN